MTRHPHLVRLICVLLLTVHTALVGYAARCHSPTIDEVGHMAAGIGIWQQGRLDLYCVNPPLVRMIATIPVLFTNPDIHWGVPQRHPRERQEFDLGQRYIESTGPSAFWAFALARWACIPFSLLAAIVAYKWAQELYGVDAALLTLTLWCFCPMVLGNAQMITPDMGATAFGLVSAYEFWHWLKRPSWWLATAAGFTLGMAELSKFTWIILFVLWPALCLAYRAASTSPRFRLKWPLELLQVGFICLSAVYWIGLGYGFDDMFVCLDDFLEFVSRAVTRGRRGRRRFVRQSFSGHLARRDSGAVASGDYVRGIDVQRHDFESKMRSYLRGEWRDHGWWYYYIYGLAIKTPIGYLALFALSLILAARGYKSLHLADTLMLLTPSAALLILVSSQTGFNHHLRYVLPALPFLYVFAGQVAASTSRFVKGSVIVMASWAIAGSLWHYPHSLSYFNESVGGPENGHYHLVDSNIDWGQDLLYLRKWMDRNPTAAPMHLAYFGLVDPRVAGIDFSLPPMILPRDFADRARDPIGSRPPPGWYAVSVTLLHGYSYSIFDGRGDKVYLDDAYFTYFLRFAPVARAGYSINIYHVLAEKDTGPD